MRNITYDGNPSKKVLITSTINYNRRSAYIPVKRIPNMTHKDGTPSMAKIGGVTGTAWCHCV